MGAMGGGAGGGGAGGGGAGGGGAGGGGAGGGGAGGGGAGGGGAGGGGAGGQWHAGGASTTDLNVSLAVMQDAIVGYWNGTADAANPLASFPADDRKVQSLDAERRVDLLTAELSARFAVSGTGASKTGPASFKPGQASLHFDGQEVFSTTGPSLDVLKAQLVWLRNYADLRFDRVAEINRQMGDILSYFGAVSRLDNTSRKHTLEFLAAALRVTYAIEMQVKFLTYTPRPVDLSSKVQPMIQTPDHSSFPSGHATESFAAASLLSLLANPAQPLSTALSQQEMPFRVAHRIASNRTIAGVHFPIDSAAGASLGCAIAQAVFAAVFKGTQVLKTSYAVPDAGSAAAADFTLGSYSTAHWTTAAVGDQPGGPITQAYNALVRQEWGQ